MSGVEKSRSSIFYVFIPDNDDEMIIQQILISSFFLQSVT